MGTNRLEAFSDGVIAIIVTIMVLELKLPPDGNPQSLAKVAPTALSYILSFVVVAIMWVNHHQLLHAAKRTDGRTLWANNFLLFCMSLIPFATAYLGQHYTDSLPAASAGSGLTGASALAAGGVTVVVRGSAPGASETRGSAPGAVVVLAT